MTLEKLIRQKEKEYVRKQTEMILAYQYRDPRRSFEAQRDMEAIRKEIKRLKKEGISKPSHIAEERFLAFLDKTYGVCPDVMKGV